MYVIIEKKCLPNIQRFVNIVETKMLFPTVSHPYGSKQLALVNKWFFLYLNLSFEVTFLKLNVSLVAFILNRFPDY